MKKVLLTSLIIGSSIASFAQGVQATQPGYAWDSFDTKEEYTNTVGDDFQLGIYSWRDTLNTAIPYFKKTTVPPLKRESLNDGVLKGDLTREGNGVLNYVVSQPHGLFIPQLGVTFGAGKSLNLTGASSSLVLKIGFKIDPASLAATQTRPGANGVKVKFSLKDINNVGIDSKGILGGKTNQYNDEIFVVIDKDGKFSVPAPLNKNTILLDDKTEPGVTFVTINFENDGADIGYEAIYPKLTDATYVTQNLCVDGLVGDDNAPIKGANKPKLGFDATKVAGFAITFLQNEQLAGDCYFKTTLTDLMFDITEFKLGNTTVGIAEDEVFNKKGFIAYPSPIKGGNIKLSATAENVKVYDVLGTMVFSANSASEINVDGFNKGLYIVKSSKGSTRFVVE